MNQFRIALIGPGSIAATYAEALKNSETVCLSAVAGRDTEKGRRFAARLRLPYYTDPEIMYEQNTPDAVLICTPTFTHEALTKQAFAHRIPVMCEKPFVLSSRTASRLATEARAQNLPLMIMHVVRFWPEYAAISGLIRENVLGPVKNIYLNRLSSHPSWALWHRDPEKSGGGLFDLHIHDIDYLYSVFGRVESVYAVGKQEKSGCFNNVSTTLRFSSGVSAVAEGFMDMTGNYPFSTAIRINGQNASVEYENRTGQTILYEQGLPARPLTVPKYNPYAREVEYFADCVQNQREPSLIPLEDVIAVLEILEAIKKSLVTGQIIRLQQAHISECADLP